MLRKLFGGGKKEQVDTDFNRDLEHAKREIRSRAEKSMRQGLPRQVICDEMLKLSRRNMPLVLLRAYSDVEHELFSLMVERNLRGRELEKKGREDQAIALYEENLVDGFSGTHPYTRLRIIYTRRKDYRNAMRVCSVYLALPPNGRKNDKPKFRDFLRKLEKKEQIGNG